jgi:hypothetical protein
MNAKHMFLAAMVIGVFAVAPALQAANFSPPKFKLHTRKFVVGSKFHDVGRSAALKLTANQPGGARRFVNTTAFRPSPVRVLMPSYTNEVVRFQKTTTQSNRRFEDLVERRQLRESQRLATPGTWIGSTYPTRREF